MTANTFSIRRIASTALAVFLILILWGLFAFLPVTYKDWIDAFRPAALHWQNPYFDPGLIFNPPWIFPFLHPLALLPPRFGAGLLMLLSLVVVALYVGSPKKLLIVVIAAPMSTLFTLGQLDALLLVGLMLPGWAGVPFLLAKPQGVILTLLNRKRRNRHTLIAIIVILLVSVAGWGFWWQNIIGFAPNQTVNMSLFPYSLLITLPLLYFGWKNESDGLLALASLSLMPYFMITSTLPAIAALIEETDNWRWWALIIVVSWIHLLAVRGVF